MAKTTLHTVNKSPFDNGTLQTCLKFVRQESAVLLIEDGLPQPTRKALERVGHKLVPLKAKASVQAVEVTGSGAARMLHATSDPRKGGVPAGY